MDFIRLTPEQRQSFEHSGFLVVPHALGGEQVDRLLEAGDRHAAVFLNKAEIRHKPWYNDLDLRPGLLELDPFYDLIANSRTVSLVVQLLSPNIHLVSASLVYKRPEDPNLPPFRRGWHRDFRMFRDLGHGGMPRVGLKVCYCFTDLQGPDSGMTLMARQSHLRGEALAIPSGEIDPPDHEVCDLTLKAGDAVIFDNRIFHTATPNRSDRVAKRVIYGYAYRWMKQEIYLDVPNLDRFNKADPITYQLLGGYRDIDTPPWALQKWVQEHGVAPALVPWTVEVASL